jgi:hypothetical protein
MGAAGRAHSRVLCGGSCGCSGESAFGAVEEATAEAAKHGDRSEPLAALLAEAMTMLEQARAEQAERARAAAEAAEAAAAAEAEAEAVAAAKRQLVAELAALELRTKQLQSELGSTSQPPTRRRRAWCAWTQPRTERCCRACTCACVRRVRPC